MAKRKAKKVVKAEQSDGLDILLQAALNELIATKKAALSTIFDSVSKGNSLVNACSQAGISVTTFWYWRQKSEKVRELFSAVLSARQVVMEDSLYAAGVKGNVTAQIFWLCNRAPSEWKNLHRYDIDQTLRGPEDSEKRKKLRALLQSDGNGGTLWKRWKAVAGGAVDAEPDDGDGNDGDGGAIDPE